MSKVKNQDTNKVVQILMNRDGLTVEEAKDQIAYVREEMLAAIENGEYDEAEDILAYELGLEPDYIFDILY